MEATHTFQDQQPFWDKIAAKYARKPVADPAAYEQKLTRVRALLRPRDRVLELGCGTGSTALALASSVSEITATDISKEMITIAEGKRKAIGATNVTFRQADAVAVPPGAPFDVVAAYSLLHLVDDIPTVLQRAHSALKPGGLFISKTVCLGDANILLRNFVRILSLLGVAPRVRVTTRRQLERDLEWAGFELLEHRYFGKGRLNPFIVARRSA